MSHTPGPWKAICEEHFQTLNIHVGTDQTLVTFMAGSLPDEERKANAVLIAAAPDLLAACEMLAELDDCNDQRDQLAAFDSKHGIGPGTGRYSLIFDAARKAIAKAKGT